jgi:hypothetical protein
MFDLKDLKKFMDIDDECLTADFVDQLAAQGC